MYFSSNFVHFHTVEYIQSARAFYLWHHSLEKSYICIRWLQSISIKLWKIWDSVCICQSNFLEPLSWWGVSTQNMQCNIKQSDLQNNEWYIMVKWGRSEPFTTLVVDYYLFESGKKFTKMNKIVLMLLLMERDS